MSAQLSVWHVGSVTVSCLSLYLPLVLLLLLLLQAVIAAAADVLLLLLPTSSCCCCSHPTIGEWHQCVSHVR